MTPAARIATHQAEAAAMQMLARPVTDIPSTLIVGMRLAQLEVVHDRPWDEFQIEADAIYAASRAALLGMLAVAEQVEGV